jgi:hypothetical protein
MRSGEEAVSKDKQLETTSSSQNSLARAAIAFAFSFVMDIFVPVSSYFTKTSKISSGAGLWTSYVVAMNTSG